MNREELLKLYDLDLEDLVGWGFHPNKFKMFKILFDYSGIKLACGVKIRCIPRKIKIFSE